jgi:type IV pilus assembly protein PilA
LKNKKGFTLIELLVVIAIIGILSAVVLASLNIARGKGANAAIKQNMNALRAQAEVYYDASPTGYTGVCADPQIVKIRNAANLASGGTTYCLDVPSSIWVVSSPLKVPDGANNFWCVDGSGVARGHVSALTTETACP